MRKVAVRPRFRTALHVTVAVLALAVAVGGMPTRASAESEGAPDPATITTTLQPGWNMVAWLGPEAPVTDLFEAIPALERVSAWDAAEQRYQRRTRNSIPRYGLRQLTTGIGLWLELGGDEPFEWTRPVLAQGTLLPLHAGRNLVGWVGRDGTPIADAVVRFGESLVRASRWDAAAQAYEHYRPGESDTANTLAELNHGDGLWVELTGDARWWQSGNTPSPVVFVGDVSEERQAEIRRWRRTRSVYTRNAGASKRRSPAMSGNSKPWPRSTWRSGGRARRACAQTTPAASCSGGSGASATEPTRTSTSTRYKARCASIDACSCRNGSSRERHPGQGSCTPGSHREDRGARGHRAR